MERVAVGRPALEVGPERVGSPARFDRPVVRAVQRAGDLVSGHGGIGRPDLLGLEEGDGACIGVGQSGEGLHDRSFGVVRSPR